MDNFIAEAHRKLNMNVKTGMNCSEFCDYLVVGDFVLEVYWPEKFKKYVEDFYGPIKLIEEFDLNRMHKIMYEDFGGINCVLYKNKEVAQRIREQTLKEFGEKV